MQEVFIYDFVRTPRGRGKSDGSLHSARPIELLNQLLRSVKTRNNLDTKLIDDIILGCVTPINEQGADIAKIAAILADYDETVAGVTLNRFCGSGLEAINSAAATIGFNSNDAVLAGGVESMSRTPMGSDSGAWAVDPIVANHTAFIPQGISADLIATKFNYTRAMVDKFAANSHQKAFTATKEQRFKKSIIPIKNSLGKTLLEVDETIRPETTAESLSKLNPSFEKLGAYGFDSVALQKYYEFEKINHIHHAGNSSGIVDGAALVLLGNKEFGSKIGKKPRAKIKSFAVSSADSTIMLTGPIPVTEKLLKKSKMSINDIDLFEVNEAFAVVPIHYMNYFNIPESKMNVCGGSIAMGHPLGATGAILLGTALDELERINKSTALITLCIGGGMGIATVIERV